LFCAPGVASLFCPDGQFPDGFVDGWPLSLDGVIAAEATPLAASAMADANKAMRFFIGDSFDVYGLYARAVLRRCFRKLRGYVNQGLPTRSVIPPG
jgi:hypothetical protein